MFSSPQGSWFLLLCLFPYQGDYHPVSKGKMVILFVISVSLVSIASNTEGYNPEDPGLNAVGSAAPQFLGPPPVLPPLPLRPPYPPLPLAGDCLDWLCE